MIKECIICRKINEMWKLWDEHAPVMTGALKKTQKSAKKHIATNSAIQPNHVNAWVAKKPQKQRKFYMGQWK